MITVAIFINGNPIFTRSARNLGKVTEDGKTLYLVDTGATVAHLPDDGAVALAKQMLDTVVEP